MSTNLRVEKLAFEDTNAFSKLFLSYIKNEAPLSDFLSYEPSLEGIEACATSYNFQHRDLLVDVLKNQHQSLPDNQMVLDNIEQLRQDNVFTITTGHQLNLFTGPLFFIYKILTVIRLCEQANVQSQDKKYVPVYWMATEDHDFDEINHFHLFGKKYTWDSEQSGAVGEFKPNDMQSFLDDLPEDLVAFKEIYSESETLEEAMRKLVHSLFSEYGLIILDANDARLKASFSDVIKKELTESVIESSIQGTNQQLETLGLKVQVNPRDINLFYLTKGRRERISRDGDGFVLVDSQEKKSKEEFLLELQEYPERFSPNVLLRPVYQQCVLPNVAYIGGPGELAYWMQLKSVFAAFNEVMPALIPRNFYGVIPKVVQKKMAKTNLALKDWFLPLDQLKKKVLASLNEELSLTEARTDLQTLAEKVSRQIATVDPSLKAFVESEFKKVEKQLANIEKRGNKALEKKNEVVINQAVAVVEKLFPEGGLQERHDNFLNFYVNDSEFISKLYAVTEPLDFSFNMVFYE